MPRANQCESDAVDHMQCTCGLMNVLNMEVKIADV